MKLRCVLIIKVHNSNCYNSYAAEALACTKQCNGGKVLTL